MLTLKAVFMIVCIMQITTKDYEKTINNNVFSTLKVAKNSTTTLHYAICTRIVIKHYDNKDLQFNRHDLW